MSNGRRIKSRIETFRPSGPVSAMLACELRGRARGAKTRVIEEALVAYLGPKYPKLRDRWLVLTTADELEVAP